MHPLRAILNAFHYGEGVRYADYRADLRDGIAEGNRTQFLNLLGTEWLPSEGRYDLVRAFECLHAMPRLVEAPRMMREMAGATSTVLIVNERAAETFSAPGDDLDRLCYGMSVLHCLPVCLAGFPSAGTGTIMRPDTLRRYAREAGFHDVEVLPIENTFRRFYRLGHCMDEGSGPALAAPNRG